MVKFPKRWWKVIDKACVDSPHTDGMIEYLWYFDVILNTSNYMKSGFFMWYILVGINVLGDQQNWSVQEDQRCIYWTLNIAWMERVKVCLLGKEDKNRHLIWDKHKENL